MKAGVIVFGMVLLSWFLISFGPSGPVRNPAESCAALAGSYIGRALTYLYGISVESAWKIGYALIYGSIAKEGLITSIAQLSAVEEKEAVEALELTLPQAMSLLVFFMYYIPCIATIAVIYREQERQVYFNGSSVRSHCSYSSLIPILRTSLNAISLAIQLV
nr:MAG: hypothetical protein TU36_05635 [Vulcanisaeta sp. AZ3]